jgi:hypothetical protein
MSFPLEQAKLCIEEDCGFVFAGGGRYCIKCGSTQWVWLSQYIKLLKGDNHEKINKHTINSDRS